MNSLFGAISAPLVSMSLTLVMFFLSEVIKARRQGFSTRGTPRLIHDIVLNHELGECTVHASGRVLLVLLCHGHSTNMQWSHSLLCVPLAALPRGVGLVGGGPGVSLRE